MKISIGEGTKTLFKELIVEHPGEENLVFSAKLRYHCGDSRKDLFEEVNSYLLDLSEEKQLELYNLYREALIIIEPTTFGIKNARCRDDLTNNYNYYYLLENVTPIVNEILDVLNLKNYAHTIKQSNWCSPPDGLRETISRGEYSSSMTINTDEYVQIAEFSIIMKTLLPIFSQMMRKTESITGVDYKESVTGGLIRNNDFVVNHPGYQKIVSYINNFYETKGVNPLNLSIISEGSYAQHTIFIAIFTRLCCAHIPSFDPRKNLAKLLYSAVKQFDTGQSNIREKNFNSRDESSEKKGLHEIYQVKEEVNTADIQKHTTYFTMGHYDSEDNVLVKDRFINQSLGLGINDHVLVDKVYELIPKSWEYVLTQPVLQVLQLTFSEDVSYNLYWYMNSEELMSALALASVKLAQMGLDRLSQFVLSVPNPNGELEITDNVFLLQEDEKELLLSKCDIFRMKESVSTENELVNSVMEFLSDVGSKSWHSVVEPGMSLDHQLLDNSPTGTLYPVELEREFKKEIISLITINS